MAEFWVDFSATIIVKAETEEEAKEKFFKEKLFATKKCGYIEIDNIEEISEPLKKLLVKTNKNMIQ